MANNLESINKKDLCKIVTPELVNDIIDALFWAEDNGWEEREKVDPKYESIKKYSQFKLNDKEYKIQLKLRTLKNKRNSVYWDFDILFNDADYFILCGFDNRNDLNILHIWLIHKDEIIRDRKFWRRDNFCITNRHKYILELKKYELKNELAIIKDELTKLKDEI